MYTQTPIHTSMFSNKFNHGNTAYLIEIDEELKFFITTTDIQNVKILVPGYMCGIKIRGL